MSILPLTISLSLLLRLLSTTHAFLSISTIVYLTFNTPSYSYKISFSEIPSNPSRTISPENKTCVSVIYQASGKSVPQSFLHLQGSLRNCT